MRWAIGRALGTIGAEVIFAPTYQDACDRLSSQSFAAIVVASPLEERSVVGILREVDRLQPQARVLVLCSGEGCERLLYDVPRATLFRKPFALSELMAAVAPALGVHEQPQAPIQAPAEAQA